MRKQAKASADKTPANNTDTKTPADTVVEFHAAVIEGKKILKEIEVAERGQLRLGELAAKLEPKYKDRTLAKFAEELGVAKCTLERYRNVYRAWEGKLAPGPISVPYAVLRELQTHPDREEIIREKPHLTKGDAHGIMYRRKNDAEEAKKEEQQKEQEDDWLKNNRRWFRELYAHAEEAARAVDIACNSPPEKQRELAQVPDGLMLMNLRGYGNRLIRLADLLEKFLEEDEAAARAEREAHAAQKQAEPEQAAPEVKRNRRAKAEETTVQAVA
jgi:hypothetical protein